MQRLADSQLDRQEIHLFLIFLRFLLHINVERHIFSMAYQVCNEPWGLLGLASIALAPKVNFKSPCRVGFSAVSALECNQYL